jgi:hypothetical protein
MKREIVVNPIGAVVTAEEVIPGLLVHKSHVEKLGWTLTHEASGRFVMHSSPTKKLIVELVHEKLAEYDWTQDAQVLQSTQGLPSIVLECYLAISADRVRRDRESGEKAKAKSQDKKGLTQAQWGDWDKNMAARQARTAAEKQRRKKWAKGRKRV